MRENWLNRVFMATSCRPTGFQIIIIIHVLKTLFQECNTIRTQIVSLAALQYLQVHVIINKSEIQRPFWTELSIETFEIDVSEKKKKKKKKNNGQVPKIIKFQRPTQVIERKANTNTKDSIKYN